MIVRSMRLDVALPGGQLALYARKGDTRIYTLLISLCETSVPIDIPEDWSATWRARKPDGTVIFDTATIEKGLIKAYLQTQALTVAGIMKCEIDVYGANGEALFSPCFDIYIENPVVEDGEIESTDDFSALTDALTTINGLMDTVRGAGETVDAAARAAASIDGMTVRAESLPHDENATAEISDRDGMKHIAFGIPRGEPGVISELGTNMFALQINEHGHLILTYNQADGPPPLKIQDGHLVYVID